MSRSQELFENFINRDGVDRKDLNNRTIQAGFIEYLRMRGFKEPYINTIIRVFGKESPSKYPFLDNFKYELTPESMELSEEIRKTVLHSIGESLLRESRRGE